MRSFFSWMTFFSMLAVPAVADDHTPGGRPSDDPTPIRRPGAETVPTHGLNGKLEWDGPNLYLKTPLGKKFQLFTKVKSVREKMIELADKKDLNIELDGTAVRNNANAIDVTSITRDEGDYDGYYLIHFDPGVLKGKDGVALKKEIEKLEGVKFKGHFANEDYLTVQSDLSLAGMRRLLAANPKISDKVERIERDPILRTQDK